MTNKQLYDKKYEQLPEVKRRRALRARNYRERVSKAILAYFGGQCVRCGFSDDRALQLDHVNGDGAKKRKIFGQSTAEKVSILKKITLNESVDDYQLLCSNCNWIKRSEQGETRQRKY